MEKRKLYGTIIGVIAFILVIIGATYAYWSWNSTNEQRTNIVFTVSSGFSCSADGGGDITSNDVSLAPAACTNSMYAIQRPVVVSTTQDAGKTIYLDMWLHVNSISANLAATSNFKYALTTSSSGCDQGTVIASGNFSGASANTNKILLDGKEYQATTASDTYYLYIWLDAAETDNATQNGTFSFSLGGECTDQEPTLYSKLAKSATPGTSVNFAQTSVANGTNGLYRLESTASDTHPVYFYRGNVDNNNVLFNNICWKIVRTTSTGGTKLVFNGAPSNGECNNTTGASTQLDTIKEFNTSSNSPAYVSYMYSTPYTYSYGTGTGWKYAPDIAYSNGTYTLVNKDSYVVETKSTISGTNLSYHHYTCGNATDTSCSSVKYVYFVSSSTAFYITLSNGKLLADIWDDMYNVTKQSTSSTIKSYIDEWFGENMLGVLDKLEDTVWCNDKSIYQLNGWDPDGGNPANNSSSYLYFGPYGRLQSTHVPSVGCTNKRDSYTVSDTTNGNGALTYPVGLLTMDEINMAGATTSSNSSYYLYTNQAYWSLSPYYFYFGNAFGYFVGSSGYLHGNNVNFTIGVRPAVSLAPGIKVTSGDGSATTPYIVN